jgi:hypothetical protein
MTVLLLDKKQDKGHKKPFNFYGSYDPILNEEGSFFEILEVFENIEEDNIIIVDSFYDNSISGLGYENQGKSEIDTSATKISLFNSKIPLQEKQKEIIEIIDGEPIIFDIDTCDVNCKPNEEFKNIKIKFKGIEKVKLKLEDTLSEVDYIDFDINDF